MQDIVSELAQTTITDLGFTKLNWQSCIRIFRFEEDASVTDFAFTYYGNRAAVELWHPRNPSGSELVRVIRDSIVGPFPPMEFTRWIMEEVMAPMTLGVAGHARLEERFRVATLSVFRSRPDQGQLVLHFGPTADKFYSDDGSELGLALELISA